jgi:hypothetical protein
MLLSENSSSNILTKSKSQSSGDEGVANNTPYDIIEHDVTGLAKISNAPPPDSFDALQIGSDRYIFKNFEKKKKMIILLF